MTTPTTMLTARHHRAGIGLTAAAALLGIAGTASAVGPDLAIGSLSSATKWGTVGPVTAYTIGNTLCNIGDGASQHASNTANHPVTTSGLFRLKDGRFEQIGVGWVFHEFCALQGGVCATCTPAPSCDMLGAGCSTSNTASILGQQANLGLRSEINPSTGVFPFPFTTRNQSGHAAFKRLQAETADIDPGQNVGALYFVEAQIISADDAAAGNGVNGVSHRAVTFDGSLNMLMSGGIVRSIPVLVAWMVQDLGVQLSVVDVPGDGRLMIASRATELGGGRWSYEYAVQNINSHRAVGGFTVPIGPGAHATNSGFHDVSYHSGEVYDGTDWLIETPDGTAVRWSTVAFELNPNANALRWGTLYNFRFEADAAPVAGTATLKLFRPGTPDAITAAIVRPGFGPCPGDFNNSGAPTPVTVQDVFDFLAAYFGNDLRADFDRSGTLSVQDVFDFLSAYFGPCAG